MRRDSHELRQPSTCNRSFFGLLRLASDNRSCGILNVPVIEWSAMETPSCDVGVQPTESGVGADETWRTLHWIRTREFTIASRSSDAFAPSQVMEQRYVSGRNTQAVPNWRPREGEPLRTHLRAANLRCPSPASPASLGQNRT